MGTQGSVYLMSDVESEGRLMEPGEASVCCEGESIHMGTS